MRKENSYIKGNTVRLPAEFSTETTGQSAERKKSTVKNILPDKVIIQNEKKDSFPAKRSLSPQNQSSKKCWSVEEMLNYLSDIKGLSIGKLWKEKNSQIKVKP